MPESQDHISNTIGELYVLQRKICLSANKIIYLISYELGSVRSERLRS